MEEFGARGREGEHDRESARARACEREGERGGLIELARAHGELERLDLFAQRDAPLEVAVGHGPGHLRLGLRQLRRRAHRQGRRRRREVAPEVGRRRRRRRGVVDRRVLQPWLMQGKALRPVRRDGDRRPLVFWYRGPARREPRLGAARQAHRRDRRRGPRRRLGVLARRPLPGADAHHRQPLEEVGHARGRARAQVAHGARRLVRAGLGLGSGLG